MRVSRLVTEESRSIPVSLSFRRISEGRGYGGNYRLLGRAAPSLTARLAAERLHVTRPPFEEDGQWYYETKSLAGAEIHGPFASAAAAVKDIAGK